LAGETTSKNLPPPNVTLLQDEASDILRKQARHYRVWRSRYIHPLAHCFTKDVAQQGVSVVAIVEAFDFLFPI
jgi:hypothetical protein